eukprot:91307_1
MAKVGFIGLGAMGSRIAKRLSLQQPSFDMVFYDSKKEAISALLKEMKSNHNISAASSLHDAVSQSNYVISCLPNSTQVLTTIEQCFDGNQPHPFAHTGCVWMDCTSGDAETSRHISNAYFSNHIHSLYFMDTPISGGPTKAEEGTVSCMIGCDADNEWILDQCKTDILHHISQNPSRVGNVGAGHSLKAINNLLNVGNLLILSEGLKCAQTYGIEITTALEMINASSGRSLMSMERFPKHILENNCFYDFKLGLMKKDVDNAISLMQGNTDQYRIANKISELLDIAVDKFGENADYTEVTRLYIDKKRS